MVKPQQQCGKNFPGRHRFIKRGKKEDYISREAPSVLAGLLIVAELTANLLKRFLVGACHAAILRRGLFWRRRAVHW